MSLDVYFREDVRRALRAAYLARRDSLEPGYVHALHVLAEAFAVPWEEVVSVERELETVYKLAKRINNGPSSTS